MADAAPVEDWAQYDGLVRASYSALTLHRKCAEAWYYRYQLGLKRPKTGPAPELDFGSWWGALVGADALTRGRKLGSLLAPPRIVRPVDSGPEFDQVNMTRNDVIGASRSWWDAQSPETRALWDEKLGITDLPRHLYGTFLRWRDEHAEAQANEAPLAVELEVQRAIPRSSMPFGLEGPEVVLFGFIDEVYRDLDKGLIVVRDNKTSKDILKNSAIDDMMDSQLMLYAWMGEPLLVELGAGRPRAVAFDRVRSTVPKTPVVTASGGLSKSVTAYDLRTYLEWAKGPDGDGVPWGAQGEYFKTGPRKDLPKFGFYTAEQDVIDRLSTPVWRAQFLDRTLTPVSAALVKAHLESAADTAADIWRTQARGVETGYAARSLTRSACSFCDYADLCRAQMIGGVDGEFELEQFNLVHRDGRKRLVIIDAQPQKA